MQPFPTAFWKKENLILEEDSCFSPFEKSFSENPEGSVYKMMVAKEPSTPTEAETSDGAIGLYVDKIPQSHLHRQILEEEYEFDFDLEGLGVWRMWWGELDLYFAIDKSSGNFNRFVNWETAGLNNIEEGVYGPINLNYGDIFGVTSVPTGGKTDATALSSNAYSIYEVNKNHPTADYEKLVEHFWNRPTCHWPYVKVGKSQDNNGTVFLTNEPFYEHTSRYTADPSSFAGEEIKRKGFLSANETDGMGISSSFGKEIEGEIDYPETMKHNWLDSWIRRGDLHRALGPVTYSSSEDCKTITVKCYFEKDAFQAISEYLQSNGKRNPNNWFVGNDDEHGNTFTSHDVLKAIRMGYNGYTDTSTLQQFFYRQRAKARFSFALGSKKYIRITIKGLGTDTFGGGVGSSGLNLNIGQDAALKGGTKQDEEWKGTYPESFVNKESAGLIMNNDGSFSGTPYLCAPGDSQTCKIFIDNTEKIKCVAPQIGYFEFEDASYPSIGPAEPNPIYEEGWRGNYLKGPVRIFELASSTINDEGETVNNYKGTGGNKFTLDSNLDIENGTRGGPYAGDYHYFHGLEYIDRSNFDNGKFYSTNNEIDAGNTTVNPYGNLWKNRDSTNFYDYDSDMVTPTYESPYSFIKSYELEKGDHTIDLLFDSVRCSMNGGAYYEIQIEISEEA